MAKTKSRTRIVLYLLVLLILAGLAAFAFGPRPVADTTIDFDQSTLPADLDS